MMNRAPQPQDARGEGVADPPSQLPRPSLQYRLKAWQAFQRELDPLAPPRPLRQPREH